MRLFVPMMKSAFLVACLLLNASVLSVAVTKCYNCIESSWNACARSQTRKTCDSLLGKSHCYSASGKYDNGTAIIDVVNRGCIDCSDKEKACERLKLMLSMLNYELLSCNIACCSEDRCNTLLIPLTTTQASSQATLARMVSTATQTSLNVVLFVSLLSLRLVLI
ncbi:hypothetical protein OS493_022052 [Desmophyllum pertusum]|uniref:UPAR/Ly6 domain-containing protein n=1 Tax=Desmophyllum pertusum TaxID=174260 RepID=A0A9X0CQR2_9CNID|nr:hypothetical protein OS493_022052 [Desmophyllum pertusum]